MARKDGAVEDDRKMELRRPERARHSASRGKSMDEQAKVKVKTPRPQTLFKGGEAKILAVRS